MLSLCYDKKKQYFLSNDLFNKINSEKRFVEIFHK